MRRRILAVSVVFTLAAIPAAVAAQACIGIPVAESHNTVSAEVGFPQDAMAYGAAFRHNMQGPLSFSAGYSLASYDNQEPKQHGLSADAAYELSNLELPVSVCPTVGLGFTRMSDEGVTLSTISVPVGVGFGKAFALTRQAAIIPHVIPQWVWTQATLSVDGEDLTGDDSVFAARLGATVAMARFYFGGGLTWINEEDTDPVFSIMAGMPF